VVGCGASGLRRRPDHVGVAGERTDGGPEQVLDAIDVEACCPGAGRGAVAEVVQGDGAARCWRTSLYNSSQLRGGCRGLPSVVGEDEIGVAPCCSAVVRWLPCGVVGAQQVDHGRGRGQVR